MGVRLMVMVACVATLGGCAEADPVTWSPSVERALIQNCAGCHGSSGCTVAWSCFLDEPDILKAAPTSPAFCGTSATAGECVVRTIEADTMPPGGCSTHSSCTSSDELELIRQWVADGMVL